MNKKIVTTMAAALAAGVSFAAESAAPAKLPVFLNMTAGLGKNDIIRTKRMS